MNTPRRPARRPRSGRTAARHRQDRRARLGCCSSPGLLPEEHSPDGSALAIWLGNSGIVLRFDRCVAKRFDMPRIGLTAVGRKANSGAGRCRWGRGLLAIVDAFDSMTSPQVYRAAMSRDRAIKNCAISRGGNSIRNSWCSLPSFNAEDQQQLHQRVSRRWLHDLNSAPNVVGGSYSLAAGRNELVSVRVAASAKTAGEHVRRRDFPRHQFASHAVEPRRRAAHRHRVGQHDCSGCSRPAVVKMRDERGDEIADDHCPVSYARTVRCAIAPAIRGRQPQRPRSGRRHAYHSRRRARTASIQGDYAPVARCLGRSFAGRALPQLVRTSHPRSAHATGQPCRIRPRA